MRLYKQQKDIPKQQRNSLGGPPRATSPSPDGNFPQRLKRAAEAVSRQIAGHKAMISQFNESKPPRQPVIDNPLPLKRSNAVKESGKPPVVQRKADVPKALTSVTSSNKHVAPPSTSPKLRSPPAPPGLATKKAIPQRTRNITLASPIKLQSLPSQTRSPVRNTITKSSASPAERSVTPANPTSAPLTSISEQNEDDELPLPVSCFRPLAEYLDLEEDWSDDGEELTSDFNTQITQIFNHDLEPRAKDDTVRHGEIAASLANPGVMLTQTLEPTTVLVENWSEPETNFASTPDAFEIILLHVTDFVSNDTPDIATTTPAPITPAPIISVPITLVPTTSAGTTSIELAASLFPSVSPLISSNIVIPKQLSCQPPSSTDYEFVSYIGNGAFGAVLSGIYKHNRRSCAIKIMSKATVAERDIVHAVLAEQRVMRQAAGYPYLLGLLASFHDTDNFYLVSEYCVSSLFEAQMSEADKKLASAELACAIDHLHSLGIIHRDVKLENVMIKNDGHIVLGDFGLACSVETVMSQLEDSLSMDGGNIFETVSCDICGTLPYMAPEVLCGMEYSYNVDWFAYGVFLYVFHYNKFPWLGSHENPTSYLKALMSTISLGAIFQERLFGDLLKKLFCPNQDTRGDFSIVKSARFFADIDWENVMNVGSSLSTPPKPASGERNTPHYTGDVVRCDINLDPYPNFTWLNPSMVVGESTPDASSSDFSLLSFGNPQFMGTSPPSISSRELPRGSAPEGTTDVLRNSMRSLDEGEEDPIYTFPPCWIAAYEDSAICLPARKAAMTQTTIEDDEALVRTTIRSLDADEEPVFELPSGWKEAFNPTPSPEVAPPTSSRPDAPEKNSVLPRFKSLWKRAASKFALRHV